MRPNFCADANALGLKKSAISRPRSIIQVQLLSLTWLNRLSWLPPAVDFFASSQNRTSMSSTTRLVSSRASSQHLLYLTLSVYSKANAISLFSRYCPASCSDVISVPPCVNLRYLTISNDSYIDRSRTLVLNCVKLYKPPMTSNTFCVIVKLIRQAEHLLG